MYVAVSGEVIYKRTKAMIVDENGKVPYTIGSLLNVSGLFGMPKEPIFDVHGPNAQTYRSYFKGLDEYLNILSSREIEVLHLIGKGMKSQLISDMLFISKHTVDKHRKNIINKLEAANSIDAYCKAVEMGLLKHQ